MKLNTVAIAVGAVLFSGSVLAEISANIGATSNYVWRGVTQTGDAGAVSGGLDYAHDSGFYAGTWTSSVDFGDDTTAEVDFYGGFASEFGDGIGYDVGVIYYWYPGANDELDFTEIYGSLSFGPVTGGINYTVDTEAGGNDDNVYYYVGASFDVAPTWTIGGTVGYYDFDSGDSYTHGQVDVGKSAGDFGDFTMSVSVADDDGAGVDGSTLVFVSWGKTF